MLTLDLAISHFSESETDQEDNSYPDEVLDSEWNPVLIEIQFVRTRGPKPSKPAPAVIYATQKPMHTDLLPS